MSQALPAVDIIATYRRRRSFQEIPFDDSAIDYRPFVNRLIKTLEAVAGGAVIAIDAPWGSGKTWFAENLVPELRNQDWAVTYIDAFASDYLEVSFPRNFVFQEVGYKPD